jgi:hypothetical protein
MGILYLGKFQFEDTKTFGWLRILIVLGAAYPSTILICDEETTIFEWNLTNYFTYNKYLQRIHDIEVTAGIETL